MSAGLAAGGTGRLARPSAGALEHMWWPVSSMLNLPSFAGLEGHYDLHKTEGILTPSARQENVGAIPSSRAFQPSATVELPENRFGGSSNRANEELGPRQMNTSSNQAAIEAEKIARMR